MRWLSAFMLTLLLAGAPVCADEPAAVIDVRDEPNSPAQLDNTALTAQLVQEIVELRRQMEQLQRNDAEKTRQIEDLLQRAGRQATERRTLPEVAPLIVVHQEQPPAQDSKSALDRAVQELNRSQPGTQTESPLDRAVSDLPAQPAATPARTPGDVQVRLIDISLDALFAGGTSTATEPQLLELQGGGHDPHKRGFTIQNVELFLAGAVDPYLDGAASIVYFIDPEGETVVELEEAYMTTRSLPCGLQLKAGQFFTEFGRLNPQHPHTWHWLDQPVINTRVFGPDGMRGPGVRISWLIPGDRYKEVFFGMQNANGETMASFFASEEFFEERPIGGRPFVEQNVRDLGDLVYWSRWQTSWETCCEEATWLLGMSGAIGPNATGPDGYTHVYGVDLTMKWKPAKNERGWPFVVWETEWISRRYRADNFRDIGDPLDPADDLDLEGDDLDDWGLYTQLLYGFKPRWATGVRYEYVGGHGHSLDEDFEEVDRDSDPFRADRHRLSPLLAWYPTEYSRFRFQYNFDYSEHLEGKDAHSFWIGAEWLYGAHPAHKF